MLKKHDGSGQSDHFTQVNMADCPVSFKDTVHLKQRKEFRKYNGRYYIEKR